MVRLRRFNLRLTQEEYEKILKLSENTTCRSVSEYARKVLSEKPVKVFYRNQSFDDFEAQMLQLLPQLESIGNSFNQALKDVSCLPEDLDREIVLRLLTSNLINLKTTIATIKNHIEILSDKCDPK